MRLRLVALGVTIVAAMTAAGASGGQRGACAGSTWITASTAAKKIVIARSDGSGRRILGTGGYSQVSPDGTKVAVVDWDVVNFQARNWRLELFSSVGGAPIHVIAIQCAPHYWSPDSTKLACVESKDAGGPVRLLIIDVASAGMTTLATGFFDGQVSFSPDSTELAYVKRARNTSRMGTLNVINLATRAIRTIRPSRAAAPAWVRPRSLSASSRRAAATTDATSPSFSPTAAAIVGSPAFA